jgi:hypothetical protein
MSNIESGGTTLKEQPQAEQTKRMKVEEFASSEKFRDLPDRFKSIAVAHAAFFVEEPDHKVEGYLKGLYANKYGGFNYHEQRNFHAPTLEDVNKKFANMLKEKVEEQKMSLEDATVYCAKEKRIYVASRVARIWFAEELKYFPGEHGQRGPSDYDATIENPNFKLANRLVLEAVAKFS